MIEGQEFILLLMIIVAIIIGIQPILTMALATLYIGELLDLKKVMGLLIGFGLCYAITLGIQTDVYRIPFVAEPQTYVLSSVLVCIAGFASGIAVRRRLDQIELVDVLKTGE